METSPTAVGEAVVIANAPSPPLRFHDAKNVAARQARCREAIDSTVFPNPTATELATTKFFLTTLCEEQTKASIRMTRSQTTGIANPNSMRINPGTGSTIKPIPPAAPSILTTLQTVLTTVSLRITTSAPAATTILAEPVVTDGKRALSPPAIALIITSLILGLIFLSALAFLLRGCLQRRQVTAQHDETSHFWHHGIFAPWQSTATQSHTSLAHRTPKPTPRPWPISKPSPYIPSDTDPTIGTHPAKTALRKILTALKPPLPLSSRQPTRDQARAAEHDAEARDHVVDDDEEDINGPLPAAPWRKTKTAKTAEEAKTRTTTNQRVGAERGRGLGLGLGADDDMVEICLGEEVVLEEQEKAERRRTAQVARWSQRERSMYGYSPFPMPQPWSVPGRGPRPVAEGSAAAMAGRGSAVVGVGVGVGREEKSRWSGSL